MPVARQQARHNSDERRKTAMKFLISQGRSQETKEFKSQHQCEQYIKDNYTDALGPVDVKIVEPKPKSKVRINWK